MLQGCYRGYRVLQRFYSGVNKVLKRVLRGVEVYYRAVTGVLQRLYRGVT